MLFELAHVRPILHLAEKHDSSSVFRKLRNAIYTNDTGTNLMDLMIVYVGSDKSSEIVA